MCVRACVRVCVCVCMRDVLRGAVCVRVCVVGGGVVINDWAFLFCNLHCCNKPYTFTNKIISILFPYFTHMKQCNAPQKNT